MTSIKWDDSLLTGDKEIDTHHQAFFVKARRIVVACGLGRGSNEVDETVQFLIDYARYHFSAEETRMDAAAYPYAETHKNQHKQFLTKLERLQESVTDSSDKDSVANELARFAVDWFVKHIQNSDQPLARHLEEIAKAQAG